jgi:hypothetical protein
MKHVWIALLALALATAALSAAVLVAVAPMASAAPTSAHRSLRPVHVVCDVDGRCAAAIRPRGGPLAREARRWSRPLEFPVAVYVGRVTKPVRAGDGLLVRKSRVKARRWHVWEIRRVVVRPIHTAR